MEPKLAIAISRFGLRLETWADQNEELGLTFDCDTEFNLLNGGDRSPDAAWISRERWNALSNQERRTFPPNLSRFYN
jgi:Uma2 family endonuclease